MNGGDLLGLFHLASRVASEVAGPILLTGIMVGLVIGILQAATQVHEAAVSFVPKLALTLAVIVAGAPFYLSRLGDLLRAAMASLAQSGGP
ncbi:MAG: flagellar biosynthetic protein FliQ [Pseudomonadota bacterium]